MPRNVFTIAASLLLLSGSQWAIAQNDIPAALTTLLKDHVYRGATYKKETIRKVQFEPSQGMLGIEFDDVEESLPIMAIVPLREITGLELSGGVATISCIQPGCITFTAENFLPAVEKLTQNRNAKLVAVNRVDKVEFGYKAANARAIGEAIVTLVKTAKGR